MDLEKLCRKRETLLSDTKATYESAIELAEKEDRALSDEEQKAFDDGKAKATGIEKQIESLNAIRNDANRLDAPDTSGRRTRPVAIANTDGGTETDFKIPATAKRHIASFASAEDAYKAGMFCAAILYGNQKATRFCEAHGISISASLNEGVNTAGGFLVPDPLLSTIIDLREEYGVFSRFAKIQPMASETANIPRKTGGLTATPTAELASAAESDSAWDRVSLTAAKWTVFTRLSKELVEDAIINLAQDVAKDIAIAFATAEDNAGFIGDGSSTYEGISGLAVKIALSAHSASVVTAASGHTAFATLTLKDFEKMVGLLPSFPGMRPAWHISKKGWAASMLGLLNAGGGNTGADLANRIEGVFLGYPVIINNSTNSTLGADTSAIKLFLGDIGMSSMLGRRSGVSIETDSSLYFKTSEIAVMGSQRFDINNHSLGDTTDPGPIIALKTPSS